MEVHMQDQSTACSGINLQLHHHLFEEQSKKRLTDLSIIKAASSLVKTDLVKGPDLFRQSSSDFGLIYAVSQQRVSKQVRHESESPHDPRDDERENTDPVNKVVNNELPHVNQEDSSREMDQCEYDFQREFLKKSPRLQNHIFTRPNRTIEIVTYHEVPLYTDQTAKSFHQKPQVLDCCAVPFSSQKKKLQLTGTKGILRKQSEPYLEGTLKNMSSHLKRVSFDQKKRVIEVPYEPRAQEGHKILRRFNITNQQVFQVQVKRSGTLQY